VVGIIFDALFAGLDDLPFGGGERRRWGATGEPPADSDVLALVRASDNCALLSTNVTHVDGRNGLRVESGFHDSS